MKFLRNKLLVIGYLLLFILPIFLVFRRILFGDLSTWGDAPFFYPEGLKELISEPLSWTQRGASFGGVNNFLFLSPLMILYGLIANNDLAIRLLFYFPSIILSGLGVYFLVKYLKLSNSVLFFAPLFYILNSYFLTLIDGGQVGVALAYGIFPFVILFGKRLLDDIGIKSFFIFLTIVTILTMADPRVAVILFGALFIWQAFEDWKKLWVLILAGILLITLNSYWLYPVIKLSFGESVLNLSFFYLPTLLNSLFLYAPHFPGNEFGKIITPPFYFAIVPFLIFGSLLFNASRRVLVLDFLILVFSFLATVPMGFIFRDPTKFFIPLTLFGGILIGETVSGIGRKAFAVFVYLFICLSVWPALFGKMNFNLSRKPAGDGFEKIYQNLKKETEFFRTVWFPEKHPLTFETQDKPVLDARDLAKIAPFSQMNASEDVFNFLNNSKFTDWLRVFGVKYLMLSGNSRNLNPFDKDSKNWEEIKSLVGANPKLKQTEWGTSFPIYELKDPYPRFYVVNRLIAVVGSYLDSTIPAVYFEDGSLNHKNLEGLDAKSAIVFFNGKGQIDLTMSFLQKFFVSPKNAAASQWAVYSHDKYLKAKYELLIRGFEYKDFDYGKGVAFSTKAGEEINFRFAVPKTEKYVLATRKADFENQSLSWVIEEKDLTKGDFEYRVVNKSGVEILNTIAIIPKNEFEEARRLGEVFVKHFGVIEEKDLKNSGWQEAIIEKEGVLKYKFTPNEKGFWLILSDNYHSFWRLRKGVEYFESVPVYSAVNGFYFEPKWGDLHIEYQGQDFFRWGVYFSIITVLALTIICLMKSKT